MEEQKILLELMHDTIERLLSPREYQVFIMSKNMRPRHIAKTLGVKSRTVINTKTNIQKKLEKHEKWLTEKRILRGL